MKVIMDFCLVPIGVGVSLGSYIAACEKILTKAGLKTHLHGYGTNIEGEWDKVMQAIKECHETIHKMGAPRISAPSTALSSMANGSRQCLPSHPHS